MGLVGLIECLDRFTAQLSANLNTHTRRNGSPDIDAIRAVHGCESRHVASKPVA